VAKPKSAFRLDALYQECLAFHRAGKLADAEKLYLKLLKSLPNNPEIVRHFAILRFQQGQPAKAIEMLEKACAANPQSAELPYSLGNMLLQAGRTAEAETQFRRSLAIAPDFPDAIANLGAALRINGRYAEAVGYLRRAIELLPSSINPLANLGFILVFMNDYAAAEEIFKRALRIDPKDQEQRLALAQTQYRRGKYANAIASYRELLAAQPGHQLAQSGLLLAKLHICDWSGLDELRKAVVEGIARASGQRLADTPGPYASLLICDDPADVLTAAKVRSAAYSGPPMASSKSAAREGDKIRVAYLSADMREHAVAYLISELIERHDRSAFEITCLSFGPNDSSPMRARMEAAFDRFEDVTALSPAAIAGRLADLSIDIAVDLQAFNQYNRMEIFSYRAAPVQVVYLGWPGGTGAPYYDYILADPIVLPTENFQHFAEKVVWLPHCYQPNDNRRKVAPAGPSRAECQLPESGFVFCCFNNPFKVLPEIFDVWMGLLQQVPGSVLWMMQNDEAGQENLRREAAARGIDASRLVFATRLPNDQHLARIAHADLFLDTLPYNAHTTSSDALWQGVPVVTCTGRTFPARVATSLLHNVGLPQLAVPSLAEYEALALDLAANPAKVRAMRSHLLKRDQPLFDTQRLAGEIESAYREMHRRALRDLPAGFIDVRMLTQE
jgi:protein O-GlcNAc transferase